MSYLVNFIAVASVSGWGFVNKKVYLNSNDELIDAEKLQIAELKILSQDDCINKMVKTDYEKLVRPGVSLDSNDRFGTRCLHRDYLCAYAPDKDACYGDSGNKSLYDLYDSVRKS